MPRPLPPEFRRRAVELARMREKPVAEIARDLGISDGCLRNGVATADTDEGIRAGLSSDERAELVALRRKNRVLELDVDEPPRCSGVRRSAGPPSRRRLVVGRPRAAGIPPS